MTFATKNIGTTRAGLAILHILIIGLIVAATMTVDMPPKNENVMMILVGALTGNMGSIINHYFAGRGNRAGG